MTRHAPVIRVVAALVLCGTAWSVTAQDTGGAAIRKIRPAEQALLDRLAGEFSKILPPVPSGWVEVDKRVFDAGGTVQNMDPAPVGAEYEWRIAVADLALREEVVERRQAALVELNRGRLEAAAAANQKVMDEYAAKIEAAITRNDQAAIKRLQEEMTARMAQGLKDATPPIASAPELSDTYARIRIAVNDYNAATVPGETRLPTPAGFVVASRRNRIESQADREGETWYLLGNWKPQAGDSWTLQFAPNKTAAVYGVVLVIEARADRAAALFLALDKARLQALLK